MPMYVFRRKYDPDVTAIIQASSIREAWIMAQVFLLSNPQISKITGLDINKLSKMYYLKRWYYMDFVPNKHILGFDL